VDPFKVVPRILKIFRLFRETANWDPFASGRGLGGGLQKEASMANTNLHDHAAHLTVTEARQAQRGRHILMVLIASVALAVIVLALAWAWRSGDLHHADSSTASRIAAASGQPLVATPVPQPPPGVNGPRPNDLSK
jgi:hypothetical protein